MKYAQALAGVAVAAITLVPLARADWTDADGHKMHHPQHPDPNGYDIAVAGWLPADDWQCSQAGYVTDIHFWFSWQGDVAGTIDEVSVNFYSDDPVGDDPTTLDDDPVNTFSHPLTTVWGRSFAGADIVVAGPFGPTSQGWDDPEPTTGNGG